MSQVPELYALGAEWAVLKGAENLNEHEGLWESDLGEFRVAINAHAVDGQTQEGLTVPPYHMLFNAPRYVMAFVLVGPTGGGGAAGMEADLIDALEADIARLRQEAAP